MAWAMGSTTFTLPDLRGVAVVGLDLGRGIDSNQLVTKAGGVDATNNRRDISGLGSFQSDAIRNISGGFGQYGWDGSAWANGVHTISGRPGGTRRSGGSIENTINISTSASYVVPTATKNQINNMALLGCIYYL